MYRAELHWSSHYGGFVERVGRTWLSSGVSIWDP